MLLLLLFSLRLCQFSFDVAALKKQTYAISISLAMYSTLHSVCASMCLCVRAYFVIYKATCSVTRLGSTLMHSWTASFRFLVRKFAFTRSLSLLVSLSISPPLSLSPSLFHSPSRFLYTYLSFSLCFYFISISHSLASACLCCCTVFLHNCQHTHANTHSKCKWQFPSTLCTPLPLCPTPFQ